MKCPHCAGECRYRERAGRVCPRCGRRFVIDPARDGVRGGDQRLRRIAERLGAGGVKYTGTQLWYAAANRVGPTEPDRFWQQTDSVYWMVVLTVVTVPTYFFSDRRSHALVPALIAVVLFVARLRYIVRQPPPSRTVVIGVDAFRRLLVRWTEVYGSPPAGLVPDDPGDGAAGIPADPVAVVVADDRAVRACLIANGLPERCRLRVVGSQTDVPAGAPVVVVHDASAAGYRFLERVRAGVDGRILGTVVPRVTTKDGLLAAPPADLSTLAEADRDLLVRGWWAPAAAMRPAVLLARVGAFVAAAGTGFLTWPEAHGERP